MTLSVGPKLGLLVHGASGEPHYDELIRQWRALDTLIQCTVISMMVATPPASPADGDTYIVAASPTGAWVGKEKNIARWSAVLGAWEFFAPLNGWKTYNVEDASDYKFNGTQWEIVSSGGTSYGVVESIVAGSGINVDSTDPANPVVSLVPTAAESLTIPIAASDESTALTVGSSKVTFHVFQAMTLTEVFAGLTVPQSGGALLTVNIKKNGTSIFSTKITIDNGEETSLTAATQAVLSTTSLSKGDRLTIDIDQIGDSTAKGLKLYLTGTKS